MTAARPGVAIDIGELVNRLADRTPELARDLLPGGARNGNEWHIAAAASPLGCSIDIHLAGSRAGIWGAWGAGTGGDALDLVTTFADLARFRYAGDRSDKAAAIRWARAWLGLDASAEHDMRNRVPAPTAQRERQAEPSAEQKRNSAFRLWTSATPLRRDDVAWRYLAGRGIDLAELPRLPGALRTMRALTYTDTGERFPVMLAAVIGPRGRFVACHRTYLQEHRDGRVTKAPVPSPKKVIGPSKGGLIPLARGPSGKAWKDAPEGDVLGLAEGIEDALSYAVAVPEHRVAATLNVGNLCHLRLPPTIATIIIAADNDAPGSPAARTLERAAARFLAEGRDVRIAHCPAGIKDLNDYLLQGTG